MTRHQRPIVSPESRVFNRACSIYISEAYHPAWAVSDNAVLLCSKLSYYKNYSANRKVRNHSYEFY
jgi:hypothetical protein